MLLNPRARRATTNSWFTASATSARTVRVMMPIGITHRVAAGKTRY